MACISTTSAQCLSPPGRAVHRWQPLPPPRRALNTTTSLHIRPIPPEAPTHTPSPLAKATPNPLDTPSSPHAPRQARRADHRTREAPRTVPTQRFLAHGSVPIVHKRIVLAMLRDLPAQPAHTTPCTGIYLSSNRASCHVLYIRPRRSDLPDCRHRPSAGSLQRPRAHGIRGLTPAPPTPRHEVECAPDTQPRIARGLFRGLGSGRAVE